jgi:hypothetical protein
MFAGIPFPNISDLRTQGNFERARSRELFQHSSRPEREIDHLEQTSADATMLKEQLELTGMIR